MPASTASVAKPKSALVSVVHTTPRLVSPAEAHALLAQTEYPFQRPLRWYQVAFLNKLIEHRQLREGTTITFTVYRRTGQRYCINGRHTLTALAQSTGRPYLLQFEEYPVDTDEEVSRLYQSYDRNLSRSWKDLYWADATLHHLDDVPPSLLEKLGGVTRLLATGFVHLAGTRRQPWDYLLKNPAFRFRLMYDWVAEMRQMQAALSGATTSTRRQLLRASVLAVALITYRFQPQRAPAFWSRLARDSGLSEGEPAWALLRYLREFGTRHIEPATYQRTVAAAWNLYYNGRPVRKLQPRPLTLPLLLLGTPHDGLQPYGYLGPDGEISHEPRPLSELDEPARPAANGA